MIKLCGFALSNYYNKVKLVLLEKQIPFEEELVWPDRSPELLARSPFGKLPFIKTEQGTLCESQVILNYLESAYVEHPLLPTNPFAAAKIQELIAFLELHLELVVRELYPEAFFGGLVSDQIKIKVEKQLTRNIKAASNLFKFNPYICGEEFTLADCAAAVHLPLLSAATKIIYGRDFLAELPAQDYCKRMAERPAMQKMLADRKVNQTLMAEWLKK